jgi:uncharacterized protein (TIGR02001 family)
MQFSTGGVGLPLASPQSTRQTASNLRISLRESLIVIRPSRIWLCLALVATAAQADTVNVWTGSIGGTSDFVFRGLSLTRGKPAAQASLDVEFPREFYLGAFVATADPNPGPSPPVEMDIWVGRYWSLSQNFSADVRLSQYTYPDDPRRVNYNRSEITGTLGYRNRMFVAAIYSPNTRAVASSPGYDEGNAWALELSARHPFNERFALSAGIGHYGLDEIYHDSYNYWNVTLTATLAAFELQLAYLGADDSAEDHFSDEVTGDRMAFTALWRFSTAR